MKVNTLLQKVFIAIVIIGFVFPFAGQTQVFQSNKSGNQEFLPGTIVIKVKEGIGPFEKQEKTIAFGIPSLDEKVRKYNISLLRKRFKHKPITKNSGLPDLSRIYRIEFPESQNIHQVVSAFADDPNIEYAEPVSIGKFTVVPNDALYATQQHLPQIMAAEAWDIHKGENGDEIVIGIVDSGTDWLHPDLTENCWQNMGEDADGDGVTLEFNNGVWERDPGDMNGIDDDGNGFVDDVIGWDFHEETTLGDGSNPDPLWGQGPYEHGSHCAGIAAGVTDNGTGIASVSWNVKYMPVQTDDGNNTVLYGIDGVIYAAENGADIITNSWYHGYNYSQSDNDAIQYALGLGSIVCFAAANDNSDAVALPGGYPGVISVAAVNPDDTRASFSNYGIAIDISAPGVSILSTVTNNNYASWNGTSMATPMVAGLFGLLKSYHPSWTNDQLIEQLIATADDIDDVNPDYENALGSGRINAYHALVDENVEVPQELRLNLMEYSIADENNNDILEAGETCTLSFSMQNYASFVGDESATFTLSSYSPDISLTSSTVTASIPADGVFEVTDAFEFVIAEDAEVQLADFILEVTADKEITYGGETELATIIAPSGFLVWEGKAGVQDYSGAFIRDFLEEREYDVFYSTTFPESFAGFEAVFLSFGGSGQESDDGTELQESQSIIIQQYLELGGRLYVEGAPFFYMSEYWDYINHSELVNLFGISTGWGELVETPLGTLNGAEGAFTEGMTFNSSNQTNNWYIDKVVPLEGTIVSFSEENYGDVSVYNEGEYGQKTFYLAYILAELEDEDPHSSRYNVLLKVLDFFGYQEEDGLVANFSADNTEGETDLQVQFTDWSITDADIEINSWAWDFNEDGEIDSFDQNPNWTYATGGVFDVSLVVNGDGGETDTLVKKDFITVRKGILVYEGKQNANGYSGTFIANYLLDHFYDEVGYTNTFPTSLDGYETVFLSFGNTGLRATQLTSDMSSELYSFSLEGGKIYLEGGDAISSMNQSSLWAFGMDNSDDGQNNEITELTGLDGAITEGMEFNASNQFSMRSIDTYSVYDALPGAKVAFTESDYGIVAVEFDGSQSSGQKTFCMSYALSELEDGGGINTAEELLQRVIDFFGVSVGTEDGEEVVKNRNQLFPNPARDVFYLQLELDENTNIKMDLFDLSGKIVSSSLKSLQKGTHQLSFVISDLPPGIYYLRYRTETFSETMKWVKVK